MTHARRHTDAVVVAVTGPAGAGKSTVAAQLADALRTELGDTAVLAHVNTKPPIRAISTARQATWLLTHPGALGMALRMARARRRRSLVRDTVLWCWHLAQMGALRRAVPHTTRVVILDQGLIHWLKPEHCAIVPRVFVPDVVVEVTTSATALTTRLLRRDKAVRRRELARGDRRHRRARRVAMRLRSLPPHEARDLLEVFSTRFCAPPLDHAELDEILDATLGQPTASGPGIETSPLPPTPRRAALRAELEPRGTVWMVTNNSAENPVESLADDLSRRIAPLVDV